MKEIQKYSAVVWYGLLSFGLVMGLVFEYSFFTGRIDVLATQEADLKQKQQVYTNRKNALSALTPEVLKKSTMASLVLPPQNSALVVTSQLRTLAQARGVVFKNLSIGSQQDPTQPDVGIIQIGIIAEGTTSEMLAYLSDLQTAAPIITFDTLSLSAGGEKLLAQINLRSFWSPLPTKLPSLTENIQTLSAEEQELLTKLDSYIPPSVSSEAPTTGITDVNQTPFAPLK